MKITALAACLLLGACAGVPDKFGIETPPWGIGDVTPTAAHTLAQGPLITYCVSINGHLYDHGRACVKTDYSLSREAQGMPIWCVSAQVIDVGADEQRSLDRYVSAICSGWHPLAL